ncbi:MAG: efflux RND transporter periplasmic adaptor subunit [bacterium]|nr:efflux RND transporter periplasmic adaptor subunit [bacterium]
MSAIKQFLIMMIMMSLIISGCSKNENDTNEKNLESVPIELGSLERGDLEEMLSLTGNIQPWKKVNVAPNVPGTVDRIYVDRGDRVAKGQLLAELDTRATKLRLEQAKAGLSVAKASYEDASKNWERIKELHEKGTVSPQQFEKVQMGFKAGQAQLEQAQAAFNLAEYQLEVSIMNAPFAGVITGKYMNEGEMINPSMPGSRGVLTLMDINKVKIEVNISENQFAKVTVGLPVSVTVDAYPDEKFNGEVSIVNEAADPMSRTFAVEITVPNSNEKLKAGMFARVEITTEKRTNVWILPVDAVFAEQGNDYVYVVNNNHAIKRTVKLGLHQEEQVELISGLDESEQFVIVGKEMLKDGATVTVRSR